MKRIYREDQIKAIISEQYPDFMIDQITFDGAGHDCEAFLVNGEFIFKFPKHQCASENLLKEMSVLIEIQDILPVRVPKIEFKGCPSEIFNWYFCGYKKIDGEILTPELLKSLLPQTQEQVAVDLAHFLKVLHNIKVDNNSQDLIINIRDKYRDDYVEIKKKVTNEKKYDLMPIVDNFYKDLLSNEDYFHYNQCLVHNDFSSDHILFDKKNNKVCGIIDFGDVAISDPDYDFISLLEDEEEYGEQFGLKVLKYYHHNDIDLVLKKSRFKEKYWSIEKILYGKEYGFDDWYQEGMDDIKDRDILRISTTKRLDSC